MTNRTNLPTVTVIVPCYNSADKIRTVLDALAAQTYPVERFSVLVVDDGSTDETAAIAASYPNVEVLTQVNGGSYKARNAGVRHTQSEVLAFTDDDCRPDPNWLSIGVQTLIDSKADLVGGGIQFEYTNPKSVVEMYDANFHLKQEFYVNRMGWAATANLIVYRRVVESVDGFNESTRSGADRVFGMGATSSGFRMVYEPKAIISHPTRATLSELVKKNRRITYGKALLAYKTAHFLPRAFHRFPEGFHEPHLAQLRGFQKLRFHALFYLIEYVRVSCFVSAVISIRRTGQRNIPFRGLSSAGQSLGTSA